MRENHLSQSAAIESDDGEGENQDALQLSWLAQVAMINLRGNAEDLAFCAGVETALGLSLPVVSCTFKQNHAFKIIWVGPDDWFVMSQTHAATEICARLHAGLLGILSAVTDVSSGYGVIRLCGLRARQALAQGCPLDLHPRVFKPGQSAGSVFYKASVWLWQTQHTPVFEMLVRRSFKTYVWDLMLRAKP